jgi:hypothetical protein
LFASLFDGAQLGWIGISAEEVNHGGEVSPSAQLLDMALHCCLSTIGHLDLYAQALVQPPFSLFTLPFLADDAQRGVIQQALKEWQSVLRLEASRPNFLATRVPMTLFQVYRELMTVGDLHL